MNPAIETLQLQQLLPTPTDDASPGGLPHGAGLCADPLLAGALHKQKLSQVYLCPV
jgi:hypothetical protein